MKCPICGKKFEPRVWSQRCCSTACNQQASRLDKEHAEAEALQFVKEWLAWKRDFALGKTASNLEVTS